MCALYCLYSCRACIACRACVACLTAGAVRGLTHPTSPDGSSLSPATAQRTLRRVRVAGVKPYGSPIHGRLAMLMWTLSSRWHTGAQATNSRTRWLHSLAAALPHPLPCRRMALDVQPAWQPPPRAWGWQPPWWPQPTVSNGATLGFNPMKYPEHDSTRASSQPAAALPPLSPPALHQAPNRSIDPRHLFIGEHALGGLRGRMRLGLSRGADTNRCSALASGDRSLLGGRAHQHCWGHVSNGCVDTRDVGTGAVRERAGCVVGRVVASRSGVVGNGVGWAPNWLGA